MWPAEKVSVQKVIGTRRHEPFEVFFWNAAKGNDNLMVELQISADQDCRPMKALLQKENGRELTVKIISSYEPKPNVGNFLTKTHFISFGPSFENAFAHFRICKFSYLYIKKGARIEIRPRF